MAEIKLSKQNRETDSNIVYNLISHGEELIKIGENHLAEIILEKALRYNEPGVTNIINNLLLKLAERNGDLKKAISHSTVLVGDSPENLEWLVRHINFLINCGDLERAAQYLVSGLKIDGRSLGLRQAASKLVFLTNWSPSDMSKFCNEKYQSANLPLTNWNLVERMKKLVKEYETVEFVCSPSLNPQKIAILGIYPWWISFIIPVALLLLKLGHHVDIYWHPTLEHLFPADDWETELFVREMSQLENLQLPQGLSFIDLRTFDRDLTSELNAVVEDQNKFDTKTPFGSQGQDINGNPNPDFAIYRVKQNKKFARKLYGALTKDKKHHDLWILHDGIVWEWAIAWKLIEHTDTRKVSLDFPPQMGRIIISNDSPVGMMVTDSAWQAELQDGLSLEKDKWVLDWIQKSETSDHYHKNKSIIQFQTAEKHLDEVKSMLSNIDNPLHLILPNNAWDAFIFLEKHNNIFASYQQWLFETIKFYMKHPELNVIMRPHPVEYLHEVPQNTVEMINKKWPCLPNHIKILPSDTAINTYGLVDRASLIVTYCSDVAWEAVLRGKQAIAGASCHYTGKGIVISPNDITDYFTFLRSFSSDPNKFQVTDDQLRLAKMYAYFHANVIKKEFPWRINTTWEDINKCSLTEALSQDRWGEFQPILDIISGEKFTKFGWVGR